MKWLLRVQGESGRADGFKGSRVPADTFPRAAEIHKPLWEGFDVAGYTWVAVEEFSL